jgi:hypothetical protein
LNVEPLPVCGMGFPARFATLFRLTAFADIFLGIWLLGPSPWSRCLKPFPVVSLVLILAIMNLLYFLFKSIDPPLEFVVLIQETHYTTHRMSCVGRLTFAD